MHPVFEPQPPGPDEGEAQSHAFSPSSYIHLHPRAAYQPWVILTQKQCCLVTQLTPISVRLPCKQS